jgi:hypothetical protein
LNTINIHKKDIALILFSVSKLMKTCKYWCLNEIWIASKASLILEQEYCYHFNDSTRLTLPNIMYCCAKEWIWIWRCVPKFNIGSRRIFHPSPHNIYYHVYELMFWSNRCTYTKEHTGDPLLEQTMVAWRYRTLNVNLNGKQTHLKPSLIMN